MKNKEYQKLHDKLLSDVRVPDSTLDRARAELTKQNETKAKVKFKPQLKVLIPALACILCCLIIVPVVLFSVPKKNGKNEGKEYRIDELTRQKISSVEWFNEQNSANLFYADVESTTWLYTENGKNILVGESFSYRGCTCELYVLLNANDQIEDFAFYNDFSLCQTVGRIEYKYGISEEKYFATFGYGNEQYFVSTEATDEELLFAIVQFIVS